MIITIIAATAIKIILEYLHIIRDMYLACSLGVCVITIVLNTWMTIRRYLLASTTRIIPYLATIKENQSTRVSYLSMLSYITLGVLINTIFILPGDQFTHEQWINTILFARFTDVRSTELNSVQLIVLAITQGVANTLIGVIHENADGEGRIPDDKLSCRERIHRKEWLNFPIGTLCSL